MPGPPYSTSLPTWPLTTSLPPYDDTVSLPALASMTSPLGVPFSLSLPGLAFLTYCGTLSCLGLAALASSGEEIVSAVANASARTPGPPEREARG